MLALKPDWIGTPEGVRTGWCVEIDAGRIVGLSPADRHPHGVELPGRLLLPGLVNAHSHAFQRAFRGHVQWRGDEQDDFWTWRQAMYATANRLTPEGIEAVSRLAFLEMAEAGVTKVGEFHYLHHQPDGTRYDDPDELAHRVIRAALDVGIRIALLRVVYGRHSPGKPLQDDQRRFGDASPDEALAAVERLSKHADPRVSVGIAPHSVRAVPADWMDVLSAYDGVVHAHVAEQPGEVAACRAEHGRSPLQVFADHGLVTSRFTAVHLTRPDPGDVGILASSGASVCVCPSTELDLGDGFLPLDVRDVRLCVGSDSQAVIDLLAEARALEMHARGLAGRRNVMTPPGDRHGLAERLLRAATVDGAVALGGRGEGIAVGGPADLVAIDLRRPQAAGVPPLEAAALLANPEWVSESWVAGNPVVVGGRHPRREEIEGEAWEWLGSS